MRHFVITIDGKSSKIVRSGSFRKAEDEALKIARQYIGHKIVIVDKNNMPLRQIVVEDYQEPAPPVAPKIQQVGSNMTTHETPHATVLYSYSTPVAVILKKTGEALRTSTKYSVTTTHHINKWLGGRPAPMVDQALIDEIAAGAAGAVPYAEQPRRIHAEASIPTPAQLHAYAKKRRGEP